MQDLRQSITLSPPDENAVMAVRIKRQKRRLPRLFRQREVEKALGKIIRANVPYVISKDNFDKLHFNYEGDKEVFLQALTILSFTIRGILRLETTYEEMILLYRMAQVFPWNERMVTRTQHLHFVWLLFANHCYQFEEKFKLAANEHNKALKALKLRGGINVKDGVKRISAALGEHIRSRGEQTHQWRKTHDIVDSFALIELASTLSEVPGLPNMKVVRNWPKTVLSIEMREAIIFVESFFLEFLKTHSKELLPMARKLNRTLKRVRKT